MSDTASRLKKAATFQEGRMKVSTVLGTAAALAAVILLALVLGGTSQATGNDAGIPNITVIEAGEQPAAYPGPSTPQPPSPPPGQGSTVTPGTGGSPTPWPTTVVCGQFLRTSELGPYPIAEAGEPGAAGLCLPEVRR